MEKKETCAQCEKIIPLCICESIPKNLSVKKKILVLQHPQEISEDLSTSKLLQLSLPANVTLHRGLSVRSLSSVVKNANDSKKWLALFLGTQSDQKKFSGDGVIKFFQKKPNSPIPEIKNIEGIILLDGTWAQAKALWWRNPWLLKVNRAMIIPPQKSLYSHFRKEPRKECVSSLEATAFTLAALGENEEVTN